MTTFRFTYSPVELPPPTEMEEEMEASALLANALKRMDGLIGDYKYVGCPGAMLGCVWYRYQYVEVISWKFYTSALDSFPL